MSNRKFHKYFTRWHFLRDTHKNLQASMTLHLPVMCSTRGSFASKFLVRHSRNPLVHLLKFNSSPISHTHSLQLNSHTYREKMIEEITIKFGTKLKPTQYSWKSQLYNLPLWLFYDKTLQQTLNLNVSLRT